MANFSILENNKGRLLLIVVNFLEHAAGAERDGGLEFKQLCHRLNWEYDNFCAIMNAIDIALMIHDWRARGNGDGASVHVLICAAREHEYTRRAVSSINQEVKIQKYKAVKITKPVAGQRRVSKAMKTRGFILKEFNGTLSW